MRNKQLILLLTFGVLLIAVRVLVHVYFTGVYVDGDQTISWLSAVDQASGDFYTPYFYGQFYNISIESMASAPFIALGGKVETVVPIVSNVIGVLPFILGALFLYRQKLKNTAIIVLCLGIALPAQYHFMTAMARGFSGGLAVFVIGLWLTSYTATGIKSFGYGLLFASYIVNPNVLIILAPLGLVWLLNRINTGVRFDFKSLIPVLIGVAVTLLIYLKIQSYNKPNFEVHRLWDIEFGIGYFSESVKSLDTRFLYLFPFLPQMGSLLMAILAILPAYLAITKKRNEAIVMALSTLFIVLTLAVNKTSDGTTSTFFPFSRMYLALPFVAIVGLHFVIANKKLNNTFYGLITLLSVCGFGYQMYDVPLKAKNSVRKNTGVVQVLTIDKLCKECEKMENIQKSYNADILVYHYKTDEYTYGCKALRPTMNTLYPEYDRRYWTFAKHADSVYPTILFMDWSMMLPDQLKQHTGVFTAIEGIHYPAFLLSNNTQSIIDLYQSNNLHLRPHSE